MMKKIILSSLIYFFVSLNAWAQSFYEINWKSDDGIDYSAFITYYSDDNISVRVGYKNTLSYVVASYMCKGSYQLAPNGKKYYIMEGQNAEIIYHKLISPPHYIAHNFVFTNLDANNKYENIFATNKDYFDGSYYHLANMKLLDPNLFNEKYLLRFFIKDEPLYKVFISYAGNKDMPLNSNNGTMHLIIVSNTLDHSIGISCDRDRKILKNEFSSIAEALNMELNAIVIYGTDFTRDNLLEKVNSIQPGPDDIIIFYYRGHGYRLDNQTGEWPLMAMKYSAYQNLEGVGIEDIYHIIVNKGARLNLVFGDLCNTTIGVSQLVYIPSIGFQSGFYPDKEKLKKLFLKARGNLLSVAAKPGEGSYTSEAVGGFYTSGIINSLHKEVSIFSSDCSWQSLVNAAIQEAENRSASCLTCTTQHGIYFMDITYVN